MVVGRTGPSGVLRQSFQAPQRRFIRRVTVITFWHRTYAFRAPPQPLDGGVTPHRYGLYKFAFSGPWRAGASITISGWRAVIHEVDILAATIKMGESFAGMPSKKG